ncbi:hypothetical protein [Anatilimnocola floriformis]|uniref:hypothetical protein n=1 Tax=Anatilimnocola floriformis TaxID=2948575 RepID=UPI0020C336FE|nr:hypothetical protein [Anatilimnocola floriformis]
MNRIPLTAGWFQANNFHQAEDGGWECHRGPGVRLRLKDGAVFVSDRRKCDPPQDELVAENITNVAQLLAVFEKQKLNGPAFLD